MENDKKKKFDPLAKDWLVGNIGKEEEVKEVEDKVNKDTVEFKNILEDDETENDKPDKTEEKVKEGKEDTVGFKNILEGTTSKNVLEEDEEEVEETKED